MALNLAALKAGLQRNKVPLGVGGVAVVGGLAYMQNRRGGSGAPADGSGTVGTISAPSPGGASIAGYAGPYDSSSSDTYNALQPQLENVGSAVDELRKLWEADKSPIPVALAPSQQPGYYNRAGTAAIYRLDDAGNIDHLQFDEWAALGKPGATAVARDDLLWTQPLLGTDAPAWSKTGLAPPP